MSGHKVAGDKPLFFALIFILPVFGQTSIDAIKLCAYQRSQGPLGFRNDSIKSFNKHLGLICLNVDKKIIWRIDFRVFFEHGNHIHLHQPDS